MDNNTLKIAFLFPGQGSQYLGMGKELADNFPECREIFSIADDVLGFSISKLCFEGPKESLDETENTQPAILTVSIAVLKALQKRGIKPDITAGLSLGEYSALVCSNVLNFSEAVKLVKKRGRYMEEAVPFGKGTMAAIMGLNEEKILEVCSEASKKGIVEPSNFNCPGQIVIGGEVDAVKEGVRISKEKGALRAKMLSVSGPFHTSMLKPAAEKLEKELENIELKDMTVPIITNVTGKYVKKEKIKEILKKQVMSSVKWEQSVKMMLDEGINTFIEIGPGKVLRSFVKKINRKVKVYNVQDLDSLNKTLQGLNNL